MANAREKFGVFFCVFNFDFFLSFFAEVCLRLAQKIREGAKIDLERIQTASELTNGTRSDVQHQTYSLVQNLEAFETLSEST